MILERIQEQAKGLSRSELRVAQVILAEPSEAIRLSIAKMAKQADVSQPTVNRFCRRLGCEGYPDLKIKLAQELASQHGYRLREIPADITSEGIFSRLFEGSLALIDDAHQRVGQWPVAMFMDWVLSARTVVIMGGTVERDAVNRLAAGLKVLGVNTVTQINQKAPLGPSDLVVAFDLSGLSGSNTGLEAYRVKGARLVAISSSDINLARDADLTFPLVNDNLLIEGNEWLAQGLLRLFVDSLILATATRLEKSGAAILAKIDTA